MWFSEHQPVSRLPTVKSRHEPETSMLTDTMLRNLAGSERYKLH